MYVENMTGRQGSYAEDRMCARQATDEEAADLQLDQGSAVLIVHHVVFDLQDRPLEFAEATYPRSVGRSNRDTRLPDGASLQ